MGSSRISFTGYTYFCFRSSVDAASRTLILKFITKEMRVAHQIFTRKWRFINCLTSIWGLGKKSQSLKRKLNQISICHKIRSMIIDANLRWEWRTLRRQLMIILKFSWVFRKSIRGTGVKLTSSNKEIIWQSCSSLRPMRSSFKGLSNKKKI